MKHLQNRVRFLPKLAGVPGARGFVPIHPGSAPLQLAGASFRWRPGIFQRCFSEV